MKEQQNCKPYLKTEINSNFQVEIKSTDNECLFTFKFKPFLSVIITISVVHSVYASFFSLSLFLLLFIHFSSIEFIHEKQQQQQQIHSSMEWK